MKKVLASVLVAAFGFSLFAADIFTFAPIKGSVKSYTQTDFSVASKFGNYYRTPSIKITHSFDGFGREIDSTEISPKDVVLDKITNTYDSYGNITEQICSDSEGNIIWKNVNSYKNGKKESCSEYNMKGDLKAKIIYSYSGNNVVDETGYNGDGALVWKTLYKYDSSNKVSTISQYTSDGSLDVEETYTYLENGMIETITSYDSFSGKTTSKIFRYSDSLLTEITSYDADKTVTNRIIYKYDSVGNPVKISEYNIANKFGTTVNELISMTEVSYVY